ncbi:MAG: chromosome segregation protein ScpA, partial [Fulvivirga sp.]|nr:chromosome segregation protein ScpA [Fulvivirga sp.]
LAKEIKKLSASVDVEAELQDVDLFKLLKVYRRVMERYEIEKNKPTHEVVQYPYTITEQKDFLMRRLSTKPKMAFTEVIDSDPNKIAVIFNFLAILELLQLGMVTLHLGMGFNNFWIERLEEVPAG